MGARVARTATFVGRAEELDALDDALDAAADGVVLALIGADAGMGKTALARQFATMARGRGVPVHWGSCVEVGGAPAYWPWIQVLRTMGEDAVAIAEKSLAARTDEPFAALDTLSEVLHARADLLRVIVLDDLHRADLPSLELLRHLALTGHDLPLLVIGTHRLHPLRGDPEREAMLAEVAAVARRISPGPLDLAGVRALLEAAGGPDPGGTDLAAEVLARSGGNAFYVEQLADAVAQHGRAGLDEVPDGIRAAVRARLVPLPEATRHALARAAVLGRGFSPAVLAALCHVEVVEVPGLLAPAVEAGILTVGPTGHEFSHVLVREALVDDLDPVERAHTHADAAVALAAPSGRRVAPAVIAQHLVDAGEVADPLETARWAERAASAARRLGGHREAARWSETAAAGWAAAGDLSRQGDALARAVADLVTVGDGPGALELSGDLAALARRSGSGRLLARAALARAEVYEPTQEFDAPPLLREALAHPEVAADHDLRADLNWGLATLLGIPTVAGPRADADGARAALAELEALAADGSPLTRFRLLHARLDVESGPLSHRSRQAWFEEADEIAPRPASLVDRLQRGYWGTSLAFESGDLAEVERRLREWEQLADRSHSSFWRWRAAMARVSLSYATGRFDLAERTLAENDDRLTNLHPELAGAVQGGLLLSLRRDQGRLGEMFEGVGDGLGVIGVLVAMENGTVSDVRRQIEPLVAQIEATGPDDLYWLCLMSLLAVGAEAAGDVERCRWVADELEPYRGQMVMWGRSYVFGTPVAEAVGVARRGAGQLRRAADAFREAMTWADRAGAPGFAARARVGLASVLPDGEPERERLLHDATASATALGLGLVLREIEALDHARVGSAAGAAAGSVDASAADPSATAGVGAGARSGREAPVPVATASVRTLGRFEVVPAGRHQVARWSSRKARDALKILIARRGRAVPREELIELLWPGVDVPTGRNRLSVVLSMVRSVLDPDRLLPADPLGADRQSVALDLRLVRVDVERFLGAAHAALAGFEAGDLRATRRLALALDEADDGEFLAEDPYNDFTTSLRSLVRRTRVDVLRALARGADTVGSRAEAIAWLERLVALEPDDVAVRHELVAAYRAEGRHGEARAMLDHGERRRRDLLQ